MRKNRIVRHGAGKVEERMISQEEFAKIRDAYMCDKPNTEICRAEKIVHDYKKTIKGIRRAIEDEHDGSVIEFWMNIMKEVDGFKFDGNDIKSICIRKVMFIPTSIFIDVVTATHWFDIYTTDPEEFRKRFTKNC